MNLAPVIARLREQAATVFREIGTAADMAALGTGGMPALPAVFVIPAEESAGENYLASGATAQRVTVTFATYIALRSARDGTRGGGAMEDLHALREAVRAALHGWEPQADAEPCLFTRGELTSFEGGALVWADSWTTAYDLRSIP